MPVAFELSGHTATTALTLLLAVVATVIALLLRSARRKRRDARGAAVTTGRDKPVERRSPRGLETPSAPALADPRLIAAAIKRAEATGKNAPLPELYLTLARAQLAGGSPGEAADSLRRSIRIASQLGQHETHALARLELGDLAQADGDLTSACEHWQIARGLAQNLRQTSVLAKAESRMQQNRCPTDWVLNEF